MAYTGRNEEYIALLQQIAFRADEIFDVMSAAAIDQFVEIVAVQKHLIVSVAAVAEGVDVGGAHFDTLVNISKIDAFCAQLGEHLLTALDCDIVFMGEFYEFMEFHGKLLPYVVIDFRDICKK